MDSPSESWYFPPEPHEIDNCPFCHEEGYHDKDRNWWANHYCDFCWEELEK